MHMFTMKLAIMLMIVCMIHTVHVLRRAVGAALTRERPASDEMGRGAGFELCAKQTPAHRVWETVGAASNDLPLRPARIGQMAAEYPADHARH